MGSSFPDQHRFLPAEVSEQMESSDFPWTLSKAHEEHFTSLVHTSAISLFSIASCDICHCQTVPYVKTTILEEYPFYPPQFSSH